MGWLTKPFGLSAVCVVSVWVVLLLLRVATYLADTYGHVIWDWKYSGQVILSIITWIVLGIFIALVQPTDSEEFKSWAAEKHKQNGTEPW